MTDVRATLEQAKEQQARADFRSAERSLLLALEAAVQIYGDPTLVAESLQMLTAFYIQTKQYESAFGQATWALELLKAKAGEVHPGLAPVYRTLADLARQMGQRVDAERYEALASASEKS